MHLVRRTQRHRWIRADGEIDGQKQTEMQEVKEEPKRQEGMMTENKPHRSTSKDHGRVCRLLGKQTLKRY